MNPPFPIESSAGCLTTVDKHDSNNDDDDDDATTNANSNGNSNTETDDLMDLFSTTFRSLAADALAIRQLTDMADLLRNESAAAAATTEDDNNNNNNANANAKAALIEIDGLISVVEHKVTILRRILNEEKHALAKFETTLCLEAADQASLIRELMETLSIETTDDDNDNDNEDTATSDGDNEERNQPSPKDHQQQEQEQHRQQQEANKEADESVSSHGSSTIYNSYRQSYDSSTVINNTTNNSNISWDNDETEEEEEQQHQNNQILRRQQHQQQQQRSSSIGSNGSSIRSNESGRFAVRSGLLRSRTPNTSANANANSPHPFSGHPPQTVLLAPKTPRKRVVGFLGHNIDNNNNNRNTNERYGAWQPSFVPVTDSELERQTRYGIHMCRYDINEALQEIQTVVSKNHSLHNNNNNNNNSNSNSNNSNSNQSSSHHRRHHLKRSGGTPLPLERPGTNRIEMAQQEQQQQQQYRHLPLAQHDRKHLTNPTPAVIASAARSAQQQQKHQQQRQQQQQQPSNHRRTVSEQDLRENCAFFKHGESTARSTLQLLCSLKRLKQVPSKKSNVTYVCLFE